VPWESSLAGCCWCEVRHFAYYYTTAFLIIYLSPEAVFDALFHTSFFPEFPTDKSMPGSTVERSSSETFDKPIRGWDGKKRVTKPSFRAMSLEDSGAKAGENLGGSSISEDGRTSAEASSRESRDSTSNLFDKPIRGWGDKPTRRITKPTFREVQPEVSPEVEVPSPSHRETDRKRRVSKQSSRVPTDPEQPPSNHKLYERTSSNNFDEPSLDSSSSAKKRSAKPTLREGSGSSVGASDADAPRNPTFSRQDSMSEAFTKSVRGWGGKRVTKPSFREPKPVVAPVQIKIPRGAVPGTVLEYPGSDGEMMRVMGLLLNFNPPVQNILPW